MADTINETLENLRSAISALVEAQEACCASAGGVVDQPPNSTIPPFGGDDDQYPDSETYFDARCNAANAVFDTIRELVLWLEVNHVDLKAGIFGGITTGLITALLLSGPAGWAVTAVSSLVGILATWIISETFDFEQLGDALDDKHTDLVKALYNGQSVTMARDDFLFVLGTSTFTTSDEEKALLKIIMGYDLLNQIVNPREDMANYTSPSPVDCGTFPIQVWSFVATGEGWAFRDDSDGPNSATGLYVLARQAWEMSITTASGDNGVARGTIYLTGLSIAVVIGNSVQMDYSATSDGITGNYGIKIIYDDLSEYEVTGEAGIGAGTRTLGISVAGTIEEIEITLGRKSTTAYSFTRDVLEVRVQ